MPEGPIFLTPCCAALCCAVPCCCALQVPDELDNIPMVDEALATAAYPTNTGGTGGGRTPSRKTRWTTEQIEALIEGVEKYGLSAWRTIVMVGRRSGAALMGQAGVHVGRHVLGGRTRCVLSVALLISLACNPRAPCARPDMAYLPCACLSCRTPA